MVRILLIVCIFRIDQNYTIFQKTILFRKFSFDISLLEQEISIFI